MNKQILGLLQPWVAIQAGEHSQAIELRREEVGRMNLGVGESKNALDTGIIQHLHLVRVEKAKVLDDEDEDGQGDGEMEVGGAR